jgi:hypothetical protein
MNLLTVGSVRGVSWVVIAVAGVLLVACGSGSSNKSPPACATGAETCACYGNGTCNTGLVCLSELCVNPSTGNGGAGGTTTGLGGISGLGGTLGTGGTTAGTGGTAPGTGGTTAGSGGSTGTGGTALPTNLIKNGDFSQGKEYWDLTPQAGEAYSEDYSGGQYCVINPSSNYYLSFSLGYPPTPSDAFVVTPGASYTMAYMATASSTATVQVKIGHVETPYTQLWATTDYVTPSTTPEIFSHLITSSAGDTEAGLVFNVTLGYASEICFDNVVVVAQ